MKLRELMQQLLNETDLDSDVYVHVVDEDGKETFREVEGIALWGKSYRKSNMISCTTLEIMP